MNPPKANPKGQEKSENRKAEQAKFPRPNEGRETRPPIRVPQRTEAFRQISRRRAGAESR